MTARHLVLALAVLAAAVGVSSASATGAAAADSGDLESRRQEGAPAADAVARPREHLGLQIKEVDFLIDGKLRWIERYSPYNYGSDDPHGHLGFLITTWLTPGLHRFTARVVPYTGRAAAAPSPHACFRPRPAGRPRGNVDPERHA